MTTLSPVPSTRSSLWLNIARALQILIICLTVGLFFVSIPINDEQRRIICTLDNCPPGVLTAGSLQALRQAGMSLDTFIQWTICLDILIAASFTASAVVIFVRKPSDPVTIFVTLMLVTFGMGSFSGAIGAVGKAMPPLHWLTQIISLIGNCSMTAFLFTFPSGRFVPRWTVWIFIGWILFQIPRYYFPESQFNWMVTNPPLYQTLFVAGVVMGPVAQVYRYRRVSDAVARQQTKWVVYGLAIGLAGYLASRIASLTLEDPLGRNLIPSLALATVSVVFMLLIPASIVIAVMRFRLWEINPIINRTLVYGALSASTMAVYILGVGFFSTYFQNARLNYIFAFLATGVIAILFEPLRSRLQRWVNRLMYGERDDPAAILSRLSTRIDTALAPAEVLPLIVETVAQALRLPYAAITVILAEGEPRVVAAFGQPQPELFHFPLTYQSQQIGEMLLAPRAPGESFSSADMKLLNIIAQQAGGAAHTVNLTAELQQLNADLQQSRERLVMAQEEERRRLRRDLHDGVGPTLASLSHRIDAAAEMVATDPQASVALLHELKAQVRGTVAEIRRLVYALRPPVLDEFGLVSAIREHIAPYCGPGGLQVSIEAPESLPALPAAVEVAAYRIALEAFTNTIRHAQASRCEIKIDLIGGALWLEIVDDGAGIAETPAPGVGLSSMRERAAELGGECTIEKLPAGGTRVAARLPVIKG